MMVRRRCTTIPSPSTSVTVTAKYAADRAASGELTGKESSMPGRTMVEAMQTAYDGIAQTSCVAGFTGGKLCNGLLRKAYGFASATPANAVVDGRSSFGHRPGRCWPGAGEETWHLRGGDYACVA